jgi:hypothetical protein
MHFDNFSFGTLQIDGSTFEQDVVIGKLQLSVVEKSGAGH